MSSGPKGLSMWTLGPWRWGGTRLLPHVSSWLSQPVSLLLLPPPLPRTAGGPGRAGLQPGGLAPRPLPRPAARLARQAQPSRGQLNGEQALSPRASQGRWLGFREQLPVVDGIWGALSPTPNTGPRGGVTLPSHSDAASPTSHWPTCHIRA